MDDYQIIAQRFQGTIESIAMSVDAFAAPLSRASELMTEALLRDSKIISCGDGVDFAQAQLFSTAMLCPLELERPALPVLQLGSEGAGLTATLSTGIANERYGRQLRALGQDGDVLLVINSDNAGPALVDVVAAAHDRNINVIALSNIADGSLPGLLLGSDELLLAEAQVRSNTIELHTMALLCLCQLIEHRLFGPHARG